jgi:hypothetical protein
VGLGAHLYRRTGVMLARRFHTAQDRADCSIDSALLGLTQLLGLTLSVVLPAECLEPDALHHHDRQQGAT